MFLATYWNHVQKSDYQNLKPSNFETFNFLYSFLATYSQPKNGCYLAFQKSLVAREYQFPNLQRLIRSMGALE